MCRARRQLHASRVWLGCAGHWAALLLLGGCGSHPVKVPGQDAARDTADAVVTRDWGGSSAPPDSAADLADAVSIPVDLPLAPADAARVPVDAGMQPVDVPMAGIDGSGRSDVPAPDLPPLACRTFAPGAPAWDGGPARWVWRYDPRVADLAGLCAGYGTRPKLILEVVVKGGSNPLAPLPLCTPAELAAGGARACSVGDAHRFVADCAAAEMLLELPTDGSELEAYVHIENGVVPSSARQRATVAPECARHLVGGLVPWSGVLPSLDGGVPGPEVGRDAGDATPCPYPNTSREDGSGKTYWWFQFDWRQDNLGDICASYGPGAKMVVELSRGSTPAPVTGLPVCTGEEVMGAGGRSCAAGARLETDCMAGQMLFEADAEIGSEYAPYYFHIESPQIPDPPRRLLEPDATCSRTLHPRFLPMVPAGSPDVGADSGGLFADLYDPSRHGQPCQTNTDCPSYGQECVIDAAVTDCQVGPIGRCVPFTASNCVAWSIGCYCLRRFGGMCGGIPGTSCGNLYPPGAPVPVNPQSGTRCHACLPTPS